MNTSSKYIIVFILLLAFSGVSMADQSTPSAAGLAWADGQDVDFNWIEISDGTSLPSSAIDTSYAVTLPFAFSFYGRSFSTIYVSNNGYLTFHDYADENFASNDSLQRDQLPDSLIAVFWDDFSTLSGGTAQIYHKNVGTAPYRKFIVEYKNVTLNAGGDPLTFQVILYESINVIKFQYLNLGTLTDLELGNSATIGIRYTGTTLSDSLVYSINSPSLSNNNAVLFYPSANLSATFGIDPDTVAVGITNQPFTTTINTLSIAADSLQNLGKADSVRIANPFTNNIFVTGIRVDGENYFVLNSTSHPPDLGFATWNYSSGTQNLTILLPPLAVKDSVSVNFVETIPNTLGNYNFSTEISSRLNPGGAASGNIPLRVDATSVSRYTFAPVSDTSFVAGNSISYTLKAEDQFGNGVLNSGSVNLSAIGSSSASFNPVSPISFAGDSVLTFDVTDTVAGDFNVRAVNGSISGQSGLITVSPAGPDTLVKLSSESNIVVGTTRLLQVRLEDAFGNAISDSVVNFNVVSSGNGNFMGSDSTPTTNSSGVAEALYTASNQTSFGVDTIQVNIGGVVDSIFLPLVSGSISHFVLTVLTETPATAGTAIGVKVAARDAFNNGVINSNQIQMTPIGSSTAQFIPGSGLYFFSNDSVATITVSDNVAETFSVKASLVGDPTKQGTSDDIQIIPASPAELITLSSESNIVVGTTRLLQVRLQDVYGNAIKDSVVSFNVVSGGNGNFVGSDSTPTTDGSGVAEALYTASTQTAFGIDTIRVNIGSVVDSIFLPLVSGSISRFALKILTVTPATAGTNILVQVSARDAFNNGVISSATIHMDKIGSATAQFIPLTGNYQFSNDSVLTITVRDTKVGTFSVQAQLVSNINKQGTSDAIQIVPAALNYLQLRSRAGNKGVVLSNVDSTILSSENILLYAAGYDQFDNYINDIETAQWNSTGSLQPTITFPFIGSTYTFDPIATGSGRIHISRTGVTPDTTGLITVTAAQLSYIQIQLDSTDGGTVVGSRILTSGEMDTLFAVGYDIDNNWLGTVNSNWSVNNTRIGDFQNGLPTILGVSQVVFTADSIGNGVISASAIANPSISDQTGLYTVTGGPSDHILIRSEANNGGFAYRDVVINNLSADSSIKLYAAFYDSHNNYLGDSVVTWASNEFNVPTGPAASIVFSPTTVGSGFIYTSSAIQDDSTATINVVHGQLAHIHVQNGPTGTAQELTQPFTLVAGEDTTLYAGGYDNDNNFISLISSNWTLEGDLIGVLTSNPSTSNVLTAQTVGTAVVRATQSGGSVNGSTSTIMVLQGDPSNLMKVAETDSQSGSAGEDLPREIEVQVYDAFGNPVNNDTVRFVPLLTGLVNGNASFADVTTNALGTASVRWTLHSDTTMDSVAAYIPNYVTTPDTVFFTAFVNPGSADILEAVSVLTGSARVDTFLSSQFTVRVRDSLTNPVPSVPISFAIIRRPDGAEGDSLTTYSAMTNSLGQASTRLHLGSKIGNYIVRAFASSTSPSFIDFTGVANQPDDPDTIIVLSGKNQTGTVAQQLSNPVQFKVTDQFGNVTPNAAVNFSAFQGGSTNPSNGTTNGSGLISTLWTLGQNSGTQQLIASSADFPAVISDTVTATANPGVAASLSLVTMRKLPFDSIAAVPGENITFVVEARDQFNNLRPNSTIQFSPEAGYNALFEGSQLITNSAGQVSNVVKTDKTKDSTLFRAFITGVDTLPLHIYHIRYMTNSLQPKAVSPGDTSFQLQLQNNSPRAVSLDMNNTVFSFDDGSSFFTAHLSSPITLPANDSDTLFFETANIDSNFTNTTYTPEIAIRGSGADSLLSGNITLPINSLSIFNVRITRITASKSVVSRGEIFSVTMTVRNDGPVTIDVNALQTTLNFTPVLNPTISLVGAPSLLPNSNTNLTFNVTVPDNAVIQQYTIDGNFGGTTQGGTPVFDSGSEITDVISVVSNASIAVQNLTPNTVTNGDQFTFQATIFNSGDAGIVLDPDSTFLTFGTDTIFLFQSYALQGNNSVIVSFDTASITTPAQLAAFNPFIRVYGTENEAGFDTSFTLTQTVLVQNPPDVQVLFFNVTQDTVSQNQDSIKAQLVLTNAGALNAIARIAKRDSIRLNTTQLSGLLPANYEATNFPITLAASTNSDTIDFIYSLDPTYAPGIDTARVNYTFSDVNSGTNRDTIPPNFDTYLVQSRARLTLTNFSLTPDTATQGQSGIQLQFTLNNIGESSASILSSDLSVEFNNPHIDSLITPTIFPVVLAQGNTQQFTYDVQLDVNSSTGWDYLDLNVGHQDVRSGKHYNDIDFADLDSIFIEEHANPYQLRLQSVNTNLDSVSIGSQDVPISVRIRNTATAPISVDSLKLTFSSGTYQFTDTTFAPALSLVGNESRTINLGVTVPAGNTPGVATINAQVFGRDTQSGYRIQDLGADTTDSWRLVTPAQLAFLSINPTNVSRGQSISFTAEVQDTGQATIQYVNTQTFLDLNGIPIFATQSGKIFGNTIATLSFNPITVSLPVGVVSGSLNINNFTENGITKSVNFSPVNVTVFDSALVQVNSVTFARDTISQDMNLDIQLALLNNGSNNANAIIDSITIPTFNYSQGTNSSLSANNIRLFSLDPFVSNAFTGNVQFDINIYWHDQNIGGQNILTSNQSVIVLNSAAIRITAITHPDSVSPGQTDTVDVSVVNTGQVIANVQNISFTENIGVYTIVNLGSYQNIAPGDTETYSFQFNILSNSATGPDNINVSVVGKDTLNTNTIEADSSFNWIIESPSQVRILSASPAQSVVSQGQTNVPVKVIFENTGSEEIQIDSVFLHFSNGNTNYSGIVQTPARVLGQNGQDSLNFSVSINGNAPTGGATINASAVGRGLTSGNSVIISSANTKGFWTVQQRPQISVPLLSINEDTVSTGQGNLLLTFQVRNTGGGLPTATAQIDSMNLVINAIENDSSQFTFKPQFSTPVTLVSNSILNFNYQLTVRNSALSDEYTFQEVIYYKDVNDSGLFNMPAASGASSDLLVQQKGALDITQIKIVPDSAYLGQNNVSFTLTAQNIGEGSVSLNSSNLILHQAGNFTKALQTSGFPFILQEDDTVAIEYSVDVPSNINLAQFADTLIYAGGSLQGRDLNSNTSLTAQRDSLNSLTVVNPAEVVFDSLAPTGPFPVDSSFNFAAFVTNTGGSNLYLNSGTSLRLVKVDEPSVVVNIPIDMLNSDTKIFPGESTQLLFQPQLLTITGDFQVFIEIEGTVHQQPYHQEIPTVIIFNVGGNFQVQAPLIVPSTVSPNQDSIMVSVAISNIGPTLSIDSASTFLQFTYKDNGQPLAVLSERIDTLTKIPQNPPPQPPVQLQWRFRVPGDARTGQVELRVFLSFNNGTVLFDRPGTFTIISGINMEYVLNSLNPNLTVQGQDVSFLASFNNSGNTSLLLNKNNSYLEFSDGTHLYHALVNGNYTIQGTQDTIPDTSVIAFQAQQIDPDFIPNVYPVNFRIFGNLPNGESFIGYDTTFSSQVTVLQEADVLVDSIDISLSTIIAGQNDVEIRYYLRNSGNSPASLNSVTSVFRDSLDTDISNSWTTVSQSLSFPFVMSEQSTTTLIRRFNVSPSINPGEVKAFLSGQFNDTRKPSDSKIFGNPTIYDSVNVILPSSIYIDGLTLTNVPNADNGTVNYNQNYDLRLDLQNSGQDALQNIVVELRENNTPIDTVTLAGPVAAGETFSHIYNFTAGSVSQTRQYRAILFEAISVTSGTAVPLEQPIDNLESVTIQQPSDLTLNAFASDSTLSQSQEFKVNFQINRTGESPFGSGQVQITFPANYSLAPSTPNPVLPVDQNTLSGFWNIIAQSITTGGSDIITVGYLTKPLDENNDNQVTGNNSTTIPVQTIEFGDVQITNISIIDPAGAVDNVVSTDQTFRLKAKFSFTPSVSQNNRRAELVLPAGTGFFADSTTKILTSDSAIWQVRAPDSVSQSATNTANTDRQNNKANKQISGSSPGNVIESVREQLFDLNVILRATEENTSQPLTDTQVNQVQVQNKASLEVHAEITSPAGATDGILSTDQSFDVRVWVENTGEAPAYDNNQVVLRVLPGFDIQGSDADTILLSIETGETSAETVQIFAPSTASTSQQNLVAYIKKAAKDMNSNKSASVSKLQENVQVNIIRKTNLQVSGTIVSPPGAMDNKISYGQTFTYQAVVTNIGEADISTSPQGTVEIQLGDLLQIEDGTPVEQSFNLDQPIQWNVKVDSSMAANIIFKQIQKLHVNNKELLRTKSVSERKVDVTTSSLSKPKKAKTTEKESQLIGSESGDQFGAFNDQLTDLYEELSSLIDSTNISAMIKILPFDENTNASAFAGQPSHTTKLYIEEEPFVDVADWQMRQHWSTNQIDTIEVLVSKPDQVLIESANITLPNGFSNLGLQIQGNLYRWTIQSPANIPPNNVITVNFMGIDQNSADTVTVNRDTTITVEKEALLRLQSSAYSYRLSQNQKFTVSATISNEGQAGIIGNGILELLPGQMLLDQGEVIEKTFTSLPTTLVWNMVAPDSNVNTLVTIRIKQRPLDINKSLQVQVDPESSQVVIDVNMIPKHLFVNRIQDIKPRGNYIQGSSNVEVLGIGLRNPEVLKEDTILVEQFLLSVKDPMNENQLTNDLQNLISRVRIVSYDYFSSFSKPLREPDEFADMTIDAETANPIPVNFSVLDTVTSGDLDELVVLIDIATGAPNQNFSVGLQNISAYQTVGTNRYGVEVTDSVGNPLATILNQFESPPLSVVSGDPEKSFGNYPNPFGIDDEFTRFVFLLEQNGDVELRIFTLLGELVWSAEEKGLTPGLYDGRIQWNGYNNVGNLVLNGIYIAVLKVNYTGGEGQTFKTKVAFIK